RDKGTARVGPVADTCALGHAKVAPRHVVVETMRHVFQGQRHTAGTVVLENGQGHDLVDHAGDNHRQMRTKTAIVALKAFFVVVKAHLDKNVRIVTHDVAIAAWPAAAGNRIVTLNVELVVVVVVRRRIPAQAVHGPGSHHVGVAGVAELLGVAFKDDDVPRFHSRGFEAVNNLDQQGRTGDRANRAGHAAPFIGQCFAAHGIDLDSDHVSRFEKHFPGSLGAFRPAKLISGAAIGPGELAHALGDHAFDDLGTNLVFVADGGGVADLNDFAGIAPGHTGLRVFDFTASA